MNSQPVMKISFTQICIATLWPSFMVAIVATGLFFSAFNPEDLYPFDLDFEVNTLGAYTVGFFVFWTFCLLSSVVSIYFAITNSQKTHMDQSSQQTS